MYVQIRKCTDTSVHGTVMVCTFGSINTSVHGTDSACKCIYKYIRIWQSINLYIHYTNMYILCLEYIP
jgi:hypothetical protein